MFVQMRAMGRNEMRYEYGNTVISVHMMDGFGKKPGLWVGTRNPNMLTKVASFRNDDTARVFCKWFEYMTEISDDEPHWEGDRT